MLRAAGVRAEIRNAVVVHGWMVFYRFYCSLNLTKEHGADFDRYTTASFDGADSLLL